ncbi:MAG: hypothetical protein R6V10_02880 [bacterium]
MRLSPSGFQRGKGEGRNVSGPPRCIATSLALGSHACVALSSRPALIP